MLELPWDPTAAGRTNLITNIKGSLISLWGPLLSFHLKYQSKKKRGPAEKVLLPWAPESTWSNSINYIESKLFCIYYI